jgi:hypothetical protein
MQMVTTIGLDIAKSVFQVHGVDATGNAIVRRQLKRRYVLPFFQKLPPCLIGIEACASSHHWSHALPALGPARQRVLGDDCAERPSAADGGGAIGGGGRKYWPAARTQSGSRHLAGGEAAEEIETGCQKKDARCGSGPSSSTAADGLGSARACTRCACSCLSGDGTIRDQLSLAVTITGRG